MEVTRSKLAEELLSDREGRKILIKALRASTYDEDFEFEFHGKKYVLRKGGTYNPPHDLRIRSRLVFYPDFRGLIRYTSIFILSIGIMLSLKGNPLGISFFIVTMFSVYKIFWSLFIEEEY